MDIDSFKQDLGDIDKAIIRHKDTEFSEFIKGQLDKIFNRQAGGVRLDEGIDTEYATFEVGKVYNLVEVLSNGNQLQKKYSSVVCNEVAELSFNIQEYLKKNKK